MIDYHSSLTRCSLYVIWILWIFVINLHSSIEDESDISQLILAHQWWYNLLTLTTSWFFLWLLKCPPQPSSCFCDRLGPAGSTRMLWLYPHLMDLYKKVRSSWWLCLQDDEWSHWNLQLIIYFANKSSLYTHWVQTSTSNCIDYKLEWLLLKNHLFCFRKNLISNSSSLLSPRCSI